MARRDTALRDRLIGTWALRSCQLRDRRGKLIEEPIGARPEGRLIYTRGGDVSVHGMAARRPRGDAERMRDLQPHEKILAAETYFGYAGTWDCEGDRITHHVAVSSFPNWSGARLVRTARLDGDTLVLTGDLPATGRTLALTWERMPRTDP